MRTRYWKWGVRGGLGWDDKGDNLKDAGMSERKVTGQGADTTGGG